jgi:hypothetical protein
VRRSSQGLKGAGKAENRYYTAKELHLQVI